MIDLGNNNKAASQKEVSGMNNNKFENHKNSTFKNVLPSGVWMVRHMISDFCVSEH